MSFFDRTSLWRQGMVVATLAVSISACGSDNDDNPPPFFAVLSAFPAELAPLVERATIDDTTMINGRTFRSGSLSGVRVVLGLTGIGLVNAETTTRAVLERFDVGGVVVSGVAGSPLRIADVTVPRAWGLTDGTSYTANPEWIELAGEIATSGLSLQRCTELPAMPSQEVCLPHQPAVVVVDFGHSSDPFGGMPLACQVDSGDVFGCDIESEGTASGFAGGRHHGTEASTAIGAAEPPTEDMETAAIAREASAHGVPFIAFRAVSDGEGDPLGLPGFPAQFFAYYRLAARNAAAATIAFLERMATNLNETKKNLAQRRKAAKGASEQRNGP